MIGEADTMSGKTSRKPKSTPKVASELSSGDANKKKVSAKQSNDPLEPSPKRKRSSKKASPSRSASDQSLLIEKDSKKVQTNNIKSKQNARVGKAMDQVAELELRKQKISELQLELEREIEREKPKTTALVREDFSPVNRSRNELIVDFAPLIKYIAQRIAARLPANIELDDLISAGVIGLMDAIDKYDSSRDNKFKTYAEFRIRGAILDELRSQDWVPRSVREKAKILERAYSKIEQEKGRQATDEEVCEVLGISQDEYHEMLSQVRSVSLLSFDDLTGFSKADKKSLHSLGDGSPRVSTPFSEVNVASLKRMIAEAIRDLPEKQRLVLSLYYYEDLNLKEIGKVLDVTESRVSQLHTQAVIRLKGKLRLHWDDFVALMT
jgi:RNA polymerase sigma factor for flagellar operon FliA